MRKAIVVGGIGAEDIETVRAYLPSNYSAEVGTEHDPSIRIVGEDDHGWTLDGYVIPRLASALITVREVEPISVTVTIEDGCPIEVDAEAWREK
jgi:hypothetical protein